MNKKLYSGLVAIGLVATTHLAHAQTDSPCGTDYVNQQYGLRHPEKMVYRQDMQNLIRNVAMSQPGTGAERSTMVIPTVVHIMHMGGSENVSNAQVESALKVLNADLRRMNSDTGNTRPIFKQYGADFNVEFRLAKIDPNGNCTDGITRTFSPITYQADDAIKETSAGGKDAWPVDKYFNIWVVGKIFLDGQAGVIGYAYFPSWGMSTNYGVVIDNKYFGTTGSAQGKDGRTLTHEVGHCLELYHTFQSGCGSNCAFTGDDVCDTPPVTAASYACNFSLNTCSNDAAGPSAYTGNVPDMIENYMSYNQNFCQNIFTAGQKARSDASFQTTFLGNLITPQNLTATGTSDGFIGNPCVLKPEFRGSRATICVGDSILFTDMTENGAPGAWQWIITGPATLSSTAQSPMITFNQPGLYTVKLTVTNANGSPSVTKQNFVRVTANPGTASWMFVDAFDNQPIATGRWQPNNVPFGFGWEEKSIAAAGGNNTVYINNVGNPGDLTYEIYSPSYDLTDIIDPKLRFKTAYAEKSEGSATDKLRLYYSVDCGENWLLRWAKTGSQLASMPAGSAPVEPTQTAHWAQWENDIPTVYETATNLMVRFVFVSGGGNNVYLDDINILGTSSIQETGPGNLGISPNPTNDLLVLDLTALAEPSLQLSVYDMSGRLLLNRNISGGAALSLSTQGMGLAAGMYRVVVKGKTQTLSAKIIVTQ